MCHVSRVTRRVVTKCMMITQRRCGAVGCCCGTAVGCCGREHGATARLPPRSVRRSLVGAGTVCEKGNIFTGQDIYRQKHKVQLFIFLHFRMMKHLATGLLHLHVSRAVVWPGLELVGAVATAAQQHHSTTAVCTAPPI